MRVPPSGRRILLLTGIAVAAVTAPAQAARTQAPVLPTEDGELRGDPLGFVTSSLDVPPSLGRLVRENGVGFAVRRSPCSIRTYIGAGLFTPQSFARELAGLKGRRRLTGGATTTPLALLSGQTLTVPSRWSVERGREQGELFVVASIRLTLPRQVGPTYPDRTLVAVVIAEATPKCVARSGFALTRRLGAVARSLQVAQTAG